MIRLCEILIIAFSFISIVVLIMSFVLAIEWLLWIALPCACLSIWMIGRLP